MMWFYSTSLKFFHFLPWNEYLEDHHLLSCIHFCTSPYYWNQCTLLAKDSIDFCVFPILMMDMELDLDIHKQVEQDRLHYMDTQAHMFVALK